MFYAGVKHGSAAEYERALELFRKTDMQEERVRLMYALAAPQDDALLSRTLEWALEGKDVRSQDVYHIVAGLAAANPETMGQFLRTHWKKFYDMFGEGQFLMARIVALSTRGFASNERADEIEAFFKENPCPAADR